MTEALVRRQYLGDLQHWRDQIGISRSPAGGANESVLGLAYHLTSYPGIT